LSVGCQGGLKGECESEGVNLEIREKGILKLPDYSPRRALSD
jgi:hypothetical protein